MEILVQKSVICILSGVVACDILLIGSQPCVTVCDRVEGVKFGPKVLHIFEWPLRQFVILKLRVKYSRRGHLEYLKYWKTLGAGPLLRTPMGSLKHSPNFVAGGVRRFSPECSRSPKPHPVNYGLRPQSLSRNVRGSWSD